VLFTTTTFFEVKDGLHVVTWYKGFEKVLFGDELLSNVSEEQGSIFSKRNLLVIINMKSSNAKLRVNFNKLFGLKFMPFT
jgi:hypothetical protein